MSTLELGILICFGIVGYFFRKLQFDVAPMILAMIIGPQLEIAFRQSLMRSGGSFAIFLQSSISMILLLFSLLFLFWNIYRALKPSKAAWKKALEEDAA
jgi:putative tricarboxylic transport membrane protein